MGKNRFNIAVIAGDGIGAEVMPEGGASALCGGCQIRYQPAF